ncbi:MAG: 2,3-diaminopropionate biosynthesis protein SbnA [Pseudonocardiales bacterium]|nr:2,3-diaminopropionate biosynthesis protein SbnA [Pseudonocardiales bacterium]
MTVVSAPEQYNENQLFVDLSNLLGHSLFLKVEGMNFAGSVKLKAATEMVEGAERDGTLVAGSIIIESSSGNLGVALAMIAASKGYGFVCVTDNRCNLATRRLMQALGARVHTITEPAETGGLLGARMDYVRSQCANDSRYVWLNQYSNPNAWKAHYHTTGPAIAAEFPQVDVVFVGAGTTGTLMGVARYFAENHPHVRVVAVDAVGSVTFGGPAGRRMIPGLGTSVRPAHVDESYNDEVDMVEEADTVRTCHQLARTGFLFGGSTGTVVSGATQWLAVNDPNGELTTVALAPDMGERYLDTIYQTNWVEELYGADVLNDSATCQAAA